MFLSSVEEAHDQLLRNIYLKPPTHREILKSTDCLKPSWLSENIVQETRVTNLKVFAAN